MRVGVLTGGGDCPGLDAVIRAIVRKAERGFGGEVVGFLDARNGVLERCPMPFGFDTAVQIATDAGHAAAGGATRTVDLHLFHGVAEQLFA